MSVCALDERGRKDSNELKIMEIQFSTVYSIFFFIKTDIMTNQSFVHWIAKHLT